MAKKTGKRSVTKKAASKPSKAAPRPAAKAAKTAKVVAKPAAKAPAPAPPKRAAEAAARPAPSAAAPSLEARAEHLRDQIQQSKLSHPDPWRFGAKARGWGERAQVLVELIAARGDTASARGSLDALAAEVEGDRDFQEARRLF